MFQVILPVGLRQERSFHCIKDGPELRGEEGHIVHLVASGSHAFKGHWEQIRLGFYIYGTLDDSVEIYLSGSSFAQKQHGGLN